jgi:hypothetical protein
VPGPVIPDFWWSSQGLMPFTRQRYAVRHSFAKSLKAGDAVHRDRSRPVPLESSSKESPGEKGCAGASKGLTRPQMAIERLLDLRLRVPET